MLENCKLASWYPANMPMWVTNGVSMGQVGAHGAWAVDGPTMWDQYVFDMGSHGQD